MNNLLEVLLFHNKKNPNNILFENEKITLSYSQFYRNCTKRAAFLSKKGITAFSKVAILSNENLEILETIFAAWILEATAIPINMSLNEKNITTIINIISPDICVTSQKNISISNIPIHLFSMEPNSVQPTNPHLLHEKTGLILFTSGSSGIPKAVPLSGKSIYLNSLHTSNKISLNHEDKLFINTPGYTTSSLIHFFTMMIQGGSIVIENGIQLGAKLVNQINAYNCTLFGGVPVHFTRLVAELKKGNKLKSIRGLINSGDHLPTGVIDELLTLKNNVKLYCMYGLTEVSGRLCILDPKDLPEKKGSVGKPIHNMKILIKDSKNNCLNPGEIGTIHVSGELLTSGYLNNEIINKKEFQEGTFNTGDIGYLDKDGDLFLLGRKDDIIKIGGEKVSIKMIEQYIYKYKKFKEFFVSITNNDHIGKITELHYVLNNNEIFDKKDFLLFMKSYLPPSHIPIKYIEKKELLKTASGKIIRKV